MIIDSLLDTDFYKLTTAQAVFHNYPDTTVKYKYKNRNGDSNINIGFLSKIWKEVGHLCRLKFSREDIEYLRSTGYFKEDFLNYLSILKLDRKNIEIIKLNDSLKINITGKLLAKNIYKYGFCSKTDARFHDCSDIQYIRNTGDIYWAYGTGRCYPHDLKKGDPNQYCGFVLGN